MKTPTRLLIHHPTNMPLEYCLYDKPSPHQAIINKTATPSIGLRFQNHEYIAPNTWLRLFIPLNKHYVEAKVQVYACEVNTADTADSTSYYVSVNFYNNKEAFSAIMVEMSLRAY